MTLLADGRVLVAGGWHDAAQSDLSSAELYDPASGLFELTGSMAMARQGPQATMLGDGRVLVTGCGTDASAELYDPANGRFVAAGAMATARCRHTVTLLADGRVLLAGGRGLVGAFLETAEIYNPATGEFSETGSMKTTRENAQAVLLADGRVLIMGGDQSDGGPSANALSTAEIYDPASGMFSPTGGLLAERTAFTATMLLDGRVLVVGGFNAVDNMLNSAETYDPRSGTFSFTGSMAEAASDHTATLLADGRVLIVDSVDGSAELYVPATGAFATPARMPLTAAGPAVRLLDGSVLFPGSPSALYWP